MYASSVRVGVCGVCVCSGDLKKNKKNKLCWSLFKRLIQNVSSEWVQPGSFLFEKGVAG